MGFALGSLVYPKHMLKACDPNFSEKNALILRKEIKQFWTPDAQKVIKIYHLMYRFSVDRLYKFKKDPALMCLLEYFITKNLISRIGANQAMAKHRDAYFEAVEKMFEATHTVQGNKIILHRTLAKDASRLERERGSPKQSLESENNIVPANNNSLPF